MFAYDASLSDGVVRHARPRPERKNLREPIPSANPKDPHARCSAVPVDKRVYPYPFTIQPGSGLKYFFDKPWRSDIGILLIAKYIVCRHLIPKLRQCQVDSARSPSTGPCRPGKPTCQRASAHTRPGTSRSTETSSATSPTTPVSTPSSTRRSSQGGVTGSKTRPVPSSSPSESAR